MKALKLIAALILLLVLLLVAAIAAITLLIDPNDYKDEIRQAAREQAGVELSLDGELGWSFYPWLALELNRVGVGYPGKPALGRLQRAEVSISLPALLGGQLQMNRILLDGLVLELVNSADGNNWSAARGVAPPPDSTAAPATDHEHRDDASALAIDIEAIEIRNAALTYTDQTSASRIELSALNLSAGRIATDTPFPLTLSFTLRQLVNDRLQLNSQLKLQTQASLDPAQGRYRLAGLDSALELAATDRLPALALTLAGDVKADLNQQQVDVSALQLSTGPLTLNGDLRVDNFAEPTLSGTLNSNTFNLKQLLQALGQPAPATADPAALSQLAFAATLGGPPGSVQLKPLRLTLDDTQLDGEAGLVLASGALSLKLKGNALNADRYLPPPSEPATRNAAGTAGSRQGAAAGGWSKEEIIPLAPLRALKLNAELDLASLTLNGIAFGQPGLTLAAADGLIRLTRFSTTAFDGRIDATARLDARKTPLQISLAPRITGVQIGQALTTLANTDVLAGRLDSRADLTLQGQSLHAWVNSLSGSAQLAMAEGLIKGIDAAQSLCQGINNLSALWINAEQVDKTTPFADLSASFKLRNGVVSNNDLSARLDAMRLAGRGSINLPPQTLDYRIGLTIEDNLFNQSCSVNDRLEGVEVPVNCTGSFHDQPARLCRLDTSFIGNLLKAEARRKVEEKVGNRLEKTLQEKLGEEGAGSVLKGLLGR